MKDLWFGQDPFACFPTSAYSVDHQSLYSHHPYLSRPINEATPFVVVEVGVWKGASTLTMAEQLRSLQIGGLVIAVDTWLGSSDDWTNFKIQHSMNHVHGYPHLYHGLISNVIDRGLQDYVLSFSLDSVSDPRVLRRVAVVPNVVHIDASDDFQSMMNDLSAWWPLLPPGTALVGGSGADETDRLKIQRAVGTFSGVNRAALFESSESKFYIRKTVEA